MEHEHARKGFFGRLLDLWRGFWGNKITDAEARNAEAVYYNAISRRTLQYDKLKDAVGRLVYLRNRIESDVEQRRSDLELVECSLGTAVATGSDGRALALIRKRRTLSDDVERLTLDHARLEDQADSAKEGLGELKKAIHRLQAERTEMLARKQHAVARLEIATALEQTHGDFASADQALESVREAIARLEHRAEIGSVSGDELGLDSDISMVELRRSAEDEQDVAELQALKRELGGHLLADNLIDAEPTMSEVAS